MFKSPLVAVVDDDEAVRESLSELLLVLDMSCRTFDQAEVFLAQYERGVFSCVITDVMMPGIGGLELLRRLRSRDAAIPVIVITSDADPAIRSQAFAEGAHAFLTKPIADNVLLRHLRSALARGNRPGDHDEERGADG